MSYPSSYDSVPTVSTGDLITAAEENAQSNAINAIETTLGLNPQSSFATVTAALAAIQTSGWTYAADSGAANAFAVTLSPAPASLTTGLTVTFKAAHTTTGSCTLAVNGLSAKPLYKNGGGNIQSGDITAGQFVTAMYDSGASAFEVVGLAVGGGGGASVSSGAFASRPSAGTAGRLYLPTDTLIYSYDDGSAWHNFGPHIPMRDPNAAGTWTASSSPAPTTSDNTKGTLLLSLQGNGSDRVAYWSKSVPSAPYTITALLNITNRNATTRAAGIGLLDSASGKFVDIGVYFAGTSNVYTEKWTSTTAFSANYAIATFDNSNLVWLRIADDNTTRYFYISNDGIHWYQISSVSRTDFITPDSVIFHAYANPNNVSVGAVMMSYKEATSALSDGADF